MNDATHAVVPEEVMAFLDGELAAERAAVIATHLQTCAECSALATHFRGLSGQVAAWRVEQAPANLGEVASAASIGTHGKRKPLLDRCRRWRPASAPRWPVMVGLGVFGLVLLLVFATPNVMRSKVAANEASAVGSLRTLNTAAVTYLDTYGHYPPSLRSFGPSASGKPSEEAAELVDPVLAGGQKSGYLFTYRSYPGFGAAHVGSYTIQADPLEPGSSGYRRFSTDQSGALFANGVALGDSMPQERAQSNLPPSPGSLGKLQAQEGFETNGDKRQGREDQGSVQNGPMIARTVSLSVVVKDFDAGRTSLDSILARHHGYAASLNVATPQAGPRTLQASLRIPAPQLGAALNELRSLGRVEGEAQNGEEVSQQRADLVARLKNSRETEQRLQDVRGTRAGKVKDVLEVEQEIARVRGEVEQLEAEQKGLEHRVDFATIDLKLAEEYKAQLGTPAPSVLMQLQSLGPEPVSRGVRPQLGALAHVRWDSGLEPLAALPPRPISERSRRSLSFLWKCGNLPAATRNERPDDQGSRGRVRMPITAVTRPRPARSQRL